MSTAVFTKDKSAMEIEGNLAILRARMSFTIRRVR